MLNQVYVVLLRCSLVEVESILQHLVKSGLQKLHRIVDGFNPALT